MVSLVRGVKAVGLGIFGLGMAWAAGSNAIGNVFAWKNPELATGQFGLGEYPQARAADIQMAMSQKAPNPELFHSAALASLRAQALNAPALRILGLGAEAHGDKTGAQQYMTLAQSVSRRDSATQLWFINQEATKGNVAESLVHFDYALRVNANIQPQLFPVLAAAIADPQIQSAMIPYIKSPPNWLPSFIGYTLGNGDTASNMAYTIVAAGGLPSNDDQYRQYETQLISVLAANKRFDALQSFFRSIKGAQLGVISSLDFNKQTIDQKYAPISWALTNTSTINSEFIPGKGGSLQLHAVLASSERASIAHKLLFLRPGAYRIWVSYHWAHVSQGATVNAVMTCATDGSMIATLTPKDGGQNPVDGIMTTPANCSAVAVDLIAAAGDSSGGEELWVDDPHFMVATK